MFSGIIREIGAIERVEEHGDSWRLIISAPMFAHENTLDPVRVGDSISVSGVCLTHTAEAAGRGSFDIASETMRCTTIGEFAYIEHVVGTRVNLERSLRLSDRIDGHLVSGHVDAVSEVLRCSIEAETARYDFHMPSTLRPFLTRKGSIAIDGVSLTLGDVTDEMFSVYVIAHTQSHTIISNYVAGTKVNLEVDPLARYVVGALKTLRAEQGGER
jgi:riboflavin synthase